MIRYALIAVSQSNSAVIETVFREFALGECLWSTSTVLEASHDHPRPDVILMDMDGYSGELQRILDLLQHAFGTPLYLIGITAISDIGFRAYRSGFCKVLLRQKLMQELHEAVPALLPTIAAPKIVELRSHSDVHYLRTDEIVYLQADNNTTDFILTGDRIVHAFHTLKYYEQTLPGTFQRVHRSFMVNVRRIGHILGKKKGCYLRGSTYKIPISNTYVHNLSKMLRLLYEHPL